MKKTSDFLQRNFVEPARKDWPDRPPQPPVNFEETMKERKKLKEKG